MEKKSRGLSQFILIAGFMIISSQAPATPSGKSQVELLNCQPQKTAASPEEVLVRRAAEQAKLSQQEILARLIFAETLSTGIGKKKCSAPSEFDLMNAIGWGVMNRVSRTKTKDNPFFETIFRRNQFRTSFSSLNNNPYAQIFLCPTRHRSETGLTLEEQTLMYSRAQEIAGNLIATADETGIPEKFLGISHFFYPHSEIGEGQRPKWAKSREPEKNKGFIKALATDQSCIEFYKL